MSVGGDIFWAVAHAVTEVQAGEGRPAHPVKASEHAVQQAVE